MIGAARPSWLGRSFFPTQTTKEQDMARPKFEGSKPDKEPKGLKEGSPAEEIGRAHV